MILCRIRGRLSSDGEEGTSEKGGEVVEDTEKEYVRLPGPKLMGSGEGGVGGDDVIVGDSHRKFILKQFIYA